MTRDQGLIFTAAAALALASTITLLRAAPTPAPSTPSITRPPTTAPATQPTTQPKPLSDNVTNGLKWLVAQQNADGGWPQGEESSQMGNGMTAVKDKSNVGDTCIAVLALLRSGSTPAAGPFAENIRKGIAFVTAEVEKSDEKSLSVTSVNGTRIQGKLGPNIDTFLASLMLGETRNSMPNPAARKTVIAALDKVMDKIEKNQNANGQVAQGGWASSLAQGVAARGANVAAQSGAKVDEKTLDNFEKFSAGKQLAAADVATPAAGATPGTTGVPPTAMPTSGGAVASAGPVLLTDGAFLSGRITAGSVVTSGTLSIAGGARVRAEDAGVALYANASNLSSMQNAQNRLEDRQKELKAQLDAPSTQPADRDKLVVELKSITERAESNGINLKNATDAATKMVQDPRFIAGFGSNGGEEFLSYLNLGETLFKQGGNDWKIWDEKMTANLNTFQNKDGSWSGQHCITGRTFCTSAALMVLLIDREDTQIANQIKRR